MTRHPPIRRAGLEDAPEMARLLTPLGYPLVAADVRGRWDAWTRDGGFALVAQGEAGLVGVITLGAMHVLHRPKPVGRITALAVDPSAQGIGLGRALMWAGEEALSALGCGLVEVTSHTRRTEAHSFYTHLGYARTSYRFAKELG